MELTQEYLKELFDYRDGFLYWKVKPSYKIHAGSKVGGLCKYKRGDRYRIKIGDNSYFSSRLIFLYHHGWLPENVDHKDRNTTNDRIDNLRAATRSQNAMNKASKKNSYSKYLGVSFNHNAKKWTASIKINGKSKHLGTFAIETDAALAYNKIAEINYGEFANLNIVINE